MAISTDAVGKRYAPATYAVGREKIREYALAVGERNPLHLDVAHARRKGYKDLVAPPMFCVVYSARAMGPAILDPDVGINLATMLHGSQEFKWDEPVCDGDVIHPEGEVAYYCGNPVCPAKSGQRIGHFVGRGSMDIEGLGWKTIEALMEVGLVRDPADIFDLTVEKLLTVERFAEKSATNIYERIQAAKRRPLSRILLALGIRHVGDSTADDLARWLATRLPNEADLDAVFDVLRSVSIDELQSIEGVGGVVAESIKEYFSRPEEQEFLEKLVRAGIVPAMPAPRPATATGPFAGKTVVFTGTLERRTREDAEALVRSLGGKITGTVSAKTDLVVAGPGAGSKLEKANKIGVRVVDEDTFDGMLP